MKKGKEVFMSPGIELRGLGSLYFPDFTGTWNDSIMPVDITQRALGDRRHINT